MQGGVIMSYEVKLEPIVHIQLTKNEINLIYTALLRGNTLERVPHEYIRRQFNNILEEMAVINNKQKENK